MPKVDVYDIAGKKVDTVELKDRNIWYWSQTNSYAIVF